jgi:hypothetical protein
VDESEWRGEGNGQWRTLFDVDSQEKLVALVPLVALELFPGRPTRLGTFGTIQQVNLRLQIRLLGRNDHRECSMARGTIRCLAGHMLAGSADDALPTPSHRSARGKPSCRLVPCAFAEPLFRLPDVFRHFIASFVW